MWNILKYCEIKWNNVGQESEDRKSYVNKAEKKQSTESIIDVSVNREVTGNGGYFYVM